jgi:group I intron endonuclease
MAVIYKITNLISKKIYIGESKEKNPYTRWNQHVKTIAKNQGCPALRDAVKKYGIDNFKFEIILFCFDEDRFKYEIDYIKRFNSLVPNGYNICKGGYGGGFINKKHTDATKEKLRESSKKMYLDNPDLKRQISERNKVLMNTPEMKEKLKNSMLNSEKWKKALDDKRVGTCVRTEESKQKIRNGVNKYYSENEKFDATNIIKHREVMARASGVKVGQYSLDGVLINIFPSIREAARIINSHKNSIQVCLSGKSKYGKGFIWKKIA